MQLVAVLCALCATALGSMPESPSDDDPQESSLRSTGYKPWEKRYNVPEKDGTVYWRYNALKRLSVVCAQPKVDCSAMDLYQFGVFTGRSMRGISLTLNKTNVPFRKFYGFDSFQGLPEEATSLSADAKYEKAARNNWAAGLFNAADIYKTYSFRTLRAKIKHYIDDSRVELIKGFFNESLTPTIAARLGMRPALYVDVDADLYSSSLQALDWLFQMKLIVPGVTVIGYDDWDFGGPQGEQRAHREIAGRYGVTFKRVEPRCRPVNMCFDVVGIEKPNAASIKPGDQI